MMHRKLLATVAIATAISGCAGFKANTLPLVSAHDLQGTAPTKTKIFSRWQTESKSSLVNDQVKAAAAAVAKKQFEDAIRATNCCVLVEGPTEADVVISGTAYAENNPAAMIPAFITGLSLFTIPSWVTAKVHIAAEVTKQDKSHSYELQDSMTMVQWLPLVLAMPFVDNPIKAGKQVDENTYKNLILKIKQDGLI